jgi:ADP-ribosylglycohydrolase
MKRKAKLEPALIRWCNSNVWLAGCDVQTEYKQAIQEGRDMRTVNRQFKQLLAVPAPDASWHGTVGGQRDEAFIEKALKLTDRVQRLPYRKDFPYYEPDSLVEICKARPRGPTLAAWNGKRGKFLEHLHGGLLGRICGCMLGKPVEGADRRSILIWAQATDNWPIKDYFSMPTAQQHKAIELQKPRSLPRTASKSLLRGHIDGMVPDDDTNYTTIGFAMVKEHGKDFTSLDVAGFWGRTVPIFQTCTAERVAYRNFTNLVLPPLSGSHRNPYREWIGAQIRADYFGYANPGNPKRAADWARRDASVSHVKNGIYGEMWVAAMLAAAFVEKDWVKVIRAGLAQVPATCRLAEDVGRIITARSSGASYQAVVDQIHQQWQEADHHDWCHTNSNAQVVATALLYGEDDYEKTITRAVMAGFDTDCNGATSGSLWGVMHGVSALPAKWTAPINDRLRTHVEGYHDVSIRELAEQMVDTALRST